jgi:uncharacterized membrane protein
MYKTLKVIQVITAIISVLAFIIGWLIAPNFPVATYVLFLTSGATLFASGIIWATNAPFNKPIK